MRLERDAEEMRYLELLGATLNKAIPTRTDKEYRQDNKEQISEQKKIHYENNKEKRIEQVKVHYTNNKQKISEYKKAYYQLKKQEKLKASEPSSEESTNV